MLSSIALVAAQPASRAPAGLQVPSTASARPIYDTSARGTTARRASSADRRPPARRRRQRAARPHVFAAARRAVLRRGLRDAVRGARGARARAGPRRRADDQPLARALVRAAAAAAAGGRAARRAGGAARRAGLRVGRARGAVGGAPRRARAPPRRGRADAVAERGAEGERALAAWASRQRAARRDGRLDAERVAALDELGFEWDPIQQAFDERLGALAAALAARAPLGASLARWAGRQRAAKAAGRLPAERSRRSTS